MKRKALALAILVALLFSTAWTVFVEITVADPFMPPEVAPIGYIIRSDGTFPRVLDIRQQGNVYTFTDDIYGTIVIERNNIVLDGAGFTLQGQGSSVGIWLQDKSNVTLKNLTIRNFGYGVRFSHYVPNWYISKETNFNFPTNCTISASTILNNTYGLSLVSSLDCNILGNYVGNNTYGVSFYGSGNIFKNNTMEGNQVDFWDQNEGDNNVDTSNIVNGKPIYYWVSQHSKTVPDDAGLVILKKCSDIKVQNLNLTGQGFGLMLYNTNNSLISGNNISNNFLRGIMVSGSNNNTIIGNRITNNVYDGIEEYGSNNNIISHNLIESNKVGINHRTTSISEVISSNRIIGNGNGGLIGGSTNCTIANNYVFENSGTGISAETGCTITENNITQNKGSGIDMRSNNSVNGNYISKNDVGIWMHGVSGNTITSNAFVGNDRWAIRSDGRAQQDNLLYHNNFIRNNHNGIQIYFYRGRYDNLGANLWDNDMEGNYWSDYKSRYPDAQNVENSTVGNTPYYIDEKNQDRYPLLAPREFAALGMPSIQPPQEVNQGTNKIETTTLAIALVTSVVIVGIGLIIFKKRKT